MNMSYFASHWRPITICVALAACAIIVILRYWLPEHASEEYIYTTQWLARFILPPLALYLLFALLTAPAFRRRGKSRISAFLLLGGFALGALTFLAPKPDFTPWQLDMALSLCWTGCFLCLGFGFFFLGASASSLRSGIFCTLGSIFLAFGIAEGYLLATPQQWDGLYYDNANSRHVLSGAAEPGFPNVENGVCGIAAVPLARHVATAHRYMRYGEPMYDARYDFDQRGRRELPPASQQPQYDLMLFGCSFTFGAGLNGEETWAWQLAKSLGPDWKLTNYSFNGYAANQMLCFLEHNLVEAPTAPRRYALFLGIQDHLRRNEFFDNFPHYDLDTAGNPARSGKGKFIWLNNLPAVFHGSQLARQITRMGTGIIMGASETETRQAYLAMIAASSRLLAEKYDTKLIVMLWPDLEFLQPELEKLHIPVILARPMLPLWDDPDGTVYQIVPRYEGHPNALANGQLATGLAAYFKDMLR